MNALSRPETRRALLRHASTLALLVVLFLPLIASAATGSDGGEELSDAYTWFKGLVLGYGGKFLAIASLFIGLWAGFMKGSLGGAAIAFGATICLVVLPNVFEKMFAATLPASIVHHVEFTSPPAATTVSATLSQRVDFAPARPAAVL